ncbi:MAG: traG [Caulobacteraceae bacterium]|nr:MAG: traG [Caulobacteraceae bacterium]
MTLPVVRPMDWSLAKLERGLRLVTDQSPLLRNWPRKVAGVPITADGDGVIAYALEGHRLILGDPGEGKGTSVFIPLLLHDVRGANGRRAGMVVIDPKDAELVRLTRPVREMFSSPVFTLDPFGLAGDTDGCNPLALLNPNDVDYFARCAGLARALVGEADDDGHDGVRWQVRARELLTGIIGHVASDPSEEKTLMRLRAFIRSDADTFQTFCDAMARNAYAPDFVRQTGNELLRLFHKAPKELQGYLSVISQHTEFTDDPRLARVLARSTFDWSHVRDAGATVYITVPDAELGMAAPWLRLMVEVSLQAMRYAHLPAERRRAAADVHIVIDEAKAFGAWRMIDEGLRALRSERISLHLAYQNIAQMRAAWREGYTRITAVKVIQFLGSNDVETCEWIAKLAGETTVLDRSRSTNEGKNWSWSEGQNTGESQSEQSGWSETTGDSLAVGVNRGQSRTRSLSASHGWSHTDGSSESEATSEGWSHNTTSGSSWGGPNGGSFNGSNSESVGKSGSVTKTTGKSSSDTESFTLSRGITNSDSSGQSINLTTQSGKGKSGGTGATKTTGKNTSVGGGAQSGASESITERRRLLTVQEVRSLDRDKAVVFIERGPGVLVPKMHFHRNPALLLRIVEARLALKRKA